VFSNVLDRGSVRQDPTISPAPDVNLAVKSGETPLVGSHDLLSAGEFELGTTKGLDDVSGIVILCDNNNYGLFINKLVQNYKTFSKRNNVSNLKKPLLGRIR
jgi:hypothetical protein